MSAARSITSGAQNQRMVLCAGMQSGGTTLISWCFLQRRDTDGELDMANDCIRASFEKAREPIVWCKMTIGCFRWLDVAEFYRDLGWAPHPLLVVRDTRAVLASLLRKPYGYNGKTGDRPPLRMRLRRFLHDWELFREQGWPILGFEAFLADPPSVLRTTCRALALEWDESMLSWPKRLADLAYPSPSPNATFASHLHTDGLKASLARGEHEIDVSVLPPAELEWLEETFAAYNAFHGYPLHLPRARDLRAVAPAPALHERILRAERLAEHEG